MRSNTVKLEFNWFLDSFNWYLEKGLPGLAESIQPTYVQFDKEDPSSRYSIEIEHVSVNGPKLLETEKGRTREIYPQECRARKINYEGTADLTCESIVILVYYNF